MGPKKEFKKLVEFNLTYFTVICSEFSFKLYFYSQFLYKLNTQTPTVTSKPSFDAEASAKNFHKAFKGFGTDESLLIKELTTHSNAQRQEVKNKYLAMYGNPLEHDLKDELKGKLEDVCVALLQSRFEYDAQNLRKAIHVSIF